jgi:hypothetical protein
LLITDIGLSTHLWFSSIFPSVVTVGRDTRTTSIPYSGYRLGYLDMQHTPWGKEFDGRGRLSYTDVAALARKAIDLGIYCIVLCVHTGISNV